MAITPQTPGSIAPPISKTAESAGSVATPISKTAESAGSVATPIAKTAESAGSVVAPIAKTSESAGSVVAPIAKTAESAGTVATPISKTAETAGSVVAPIAKTAVGAAAFPRTFIPTLDLDFKNELYAQSGKPKAFDELLTYSRASSATYLDRFMDSNGDWNYFVNTGFVGSVTNLFTRSEQFDHADWGETNTNVSTNATTDPNGTITADKITADSTGSINTGIQQAFVSVVANNYTASVYVKKSEASFFQIFFAAGDVANNPHVNFDLSTGVIGSQDADIDSASIKPVGNDWFRVSATVVAVSTELLPVFSFIKTASDVRNISNTWTQGEGLFIWGASITQTSTLTPYVKTISTSTSDTFSETLRIEYDQATGESLGALIESASTNLALRSEEFDNGSWTKTNSFATADQTLGPDNSTSADKFDASTTGTNIPAIFQSIASTGTNSYTISAYVKRSEANFFQIYFNTSHVANNPRVNFDLSTGVIGSQDADIDAASITPVGNDWFRVSATVVAVGSSLTPIFILIKTAADVRAGSNSWTSGDGLFIWGAQIEEQAVPTSYIRTEGSTVSRLADLLSAPTAGNMPLGDVTFYADADINGKSGDVTQQIISVDTDGPGRQISIRLGGELSTWQGSQVVEIANNAATPLSFNCASVLNKSANTTTGFLNGVQTISQDAGGITTLEIGGVIGIGNNAPISGIQLNGHIKQLTIFDKALTAQEVSLL